MFAMMAAAGNVLITALLSNRPDRDDGCTGGLGYELSPCLEFQILNKTQIQEILKKYFGSLRSQKQDHLRRAKNKVHYIQNGYSEGYGTCSQLFNPIMHSTLVMIMTR